MECLLEESDLNFDHPNDHGLESLLAARNELGGLPLQGDIFRILFSALARIESKLDLGGTGEGQGIVFQLLDLVRLLFQSVESSEVSCTKSKKEGGLLFLERRRKPFESVLRKGKGRQLLGILRRRIRIESEPFVAGGIGRWIHFVVRYNNSSSSNNKQQQQRRERSERRQPVFECVYY